MSSIGSNIHSSGVADLFSTLFVAGILFGVVMGMLLERDVLSKDKSFQNYRNFFIAGMVVALSIIISDQHLQISLLHSSYKLDREDFLTLLNDCKTDFDELMEEKVILQRELSMFKEEITSDSSIPSEWTEEADTDEDAVSHWFHAMLTRDASGHIICPFSSPENAVTIMKTFPHWSLHLRAMSRVFHPDKMASVNCPSSFGQAAILQINKER